MPTIPLNFENRPVLGCMSINGTSSPSTLAAILKNAPPADDLGLWTTGIPRLAATTVCSSDDFHGQQTLYVLLVHHVAALNHLRRDAVDDELGPV